MIFIPVHLAALAFFMWFYAKHEADINVPKLCLVFALPIWFLTVVGSFLGIIFLPILFVVIMFALRAWFYVGMAKASAVSGSFCGYLLIFSLVFTYLSRPSNSKENESGKTGGQLVVAPDVQPAIKPALNNEQEPKKPKKPANDAMKYQTKNAGEMVFGRGHYHCAGSYCVSIERTGEGVSNKTTIYSSPKKLTTDSYENVIKVVAGSAPFYVENERSLWVLNRKNVLHITWDEGIAKVNDDPGLKEQAPQPIKDHLSPKKVVRKPKSPTAYPAKYETKGEGVFVIGRGHYHCAGSFCISTERLYNKQARDEVLQSTIYRIPRKLTTDKYQDVDKVIHGAAQFFVENKQSLWIVQRGKLSHLTWKNGKAIFREQGSLQTKPPKQVQDYIKDYIKKRRR